MKFDNFKTLGMVSAVALTVSLAAAPANAATVDSGDTQTMNVQVTVDNTFDSTVTDLDGGTIGATSDGADTADLVIATDGTITDDLVGPARIFSTTGTAATAGSVAIANAFATTDLYVDITAVNPLVCNGGGCGGAEPDFVITEVITDQATTAASFATPTTGVAATDGAGALTIGFGVTLQTEADANVYSSNDYVGDFDFTVSY